MAVWPAVLHQIGLILGLLLGGDSEASIVVFSTLQNARVRRDVLNAVADLKLTGRRRELFEAVLEVVRAAETERNHLAHGCFGCSASLPDSVLWIETKHFGPWNIATIRKETQVTANDHHELAKYIFVYKLSDLHNVLEQASDTFLITTEFFTYIRYPPATPSQADDEKYLQLCILPRVATALTRIRSRKTTTP